MTADERAIRELIATWLEASKAGDDAMVLQLMAEDAVFLLPGQPPMRGRAGFAAAKQKMAGMAIDGHADIREVEVFGDWAYCWNYLTVTVTPSGGAPLTRAGDVLTVLRKRDGRWVIFRDANMLVRVDR